MKCNDKAQRIGSSRQFRDLGTAHKDKPCLHESKLLFRKITEDRWQLFIDVVWKAYLARYYIIWSGVHDIPWADDQHLLCYKLSEAFVIVVCSELDSSTAADEARQQKKRH